MHIQGRLGSYRWIENWARIPDSPLGRENGRTHGVCVLADGRVVVFHQASPAVLLFTPDGLLQSSWGDFPGAHGLTRVSEKGEEFFWLTDQNTAQVVKTTLEGEVVQSLSAPDHEAYSSGATYSPTWADQNPVTGEIWVADGYGASLVHRFSADGTYQGALDGTEGAGRFREPHGLRFVTSADGVELFITDRANHRIVVYDGDGKFLRSSLSAHSPCMFDFLGDRMLVPELFTGVKVLDRRTLTVLEELGASDRIKPHPDGAWWPPVAPAGWPDLAGTDQVRPGFFNSPHGACFSPTGDLYVVEWIVGGRITKLERMEGVGLSDPH